MTASMSSFGCYGFATLCTMTLSGKHPPSPSPSSSSSSSSTSKDSTRPKPPQRRRRTRVPRVSRPSELARKYRSSEIGMNENNELIGGPVSTSTSTSSTKNPGSAANSNSNGNDNDNGNGTSISNSNSTSNSNSNSGRPVVRRTSRFPSTWDETVAQLSLAVEEAARDGHERIRVDLKNPELIPPKHAATVTDKVSYTTNMEYTSVSISASSEMISPKVRELQTIQRMKLLMQACNAILSTLLAKRDELPGLGGITNRSRGPAKASLFFNSPSERRLGAQFLNTNGNTNRNVEVYTLGQGNEPAAGRNDITILLCPSNTQGNPSHIEHVELVHYSNWKNHNLVVAINPALIALTRHGSLDDEPRQPSFLTDYIPSYYIDPVAYIARNATGALLRCFPRKWEMYLLKLHLDDRNRKMNNNINNIHERGFRLIGEANSRPSREKLLCEFSWRVNQPL